MKSAEPDDETGGGTVAVPRNALKTWEKVREFALGLPGAAEEFPWGETVAKVNKKVFVFLGVSDGSYPMGVTVKLKDAEAHAHALTSPGAEPAGYGLGKAGWVRVPLAEKGSPAADLLCDWVEESYRAIAPKRLTAELDTRRPGP
ncbi:putative DNA-binding protein (MmcQ/YjbR family) [Streptomyces sp. SAI-144]|nr:putative DNA-binding protein (MmcQ/YjbR family) [Streptomyces sp. SAI-144]